MKELEELQETVKTLRSPDGCPWDKEQTFKSLIPCIIEEAYELVDAIENKNLSHLKEELGDVLLHVVMLSHIAEEQHAFTLNDVAHEVNEKMIRRHPHVFGNKKAENVNQVWENWESIKKKEKNSPSIMDDIPSLPSLLEAHKIQKKAARIGFDWPDNHGPLEKLKEEIHEFSEALSTAPPNINHVEEEAGDILFSLVNILRKHDINSEEALRKTNQKFVKRFQKMEAMTDTDTFKALTLDKKEALWKKAKSIHNNK